MESVDSRCYIEGVPWEVAVQECESARGCARMREGMRECGVGIHGRMHTRFKCEDTLEITLEHL